MTTLCQFCGVNRIIPEEGSLVINKRDIYQTTNLDLSSYIKTSKHFTFTFKNHQDLIHPLSELVQEGYGDIWLQVKSTNHSSSIQAEQLLLQLQYPELTTLILNGDFSVYLQPIIEMKTNTVYGYEALLRTKEQDVGPGELFHFAQKAGLHSLLDKKARELAVKAKATKIPKQMKCFINFLPSTIYNPEFCLKHTFDVVDKYQVDPNDLVFEVVETEKIMNMNHLKNILSTYQKHGMRVALDDVGSGYSSLEVLQNLKPNFVKIDKEYVRDCHIDKEKQAFLSKVIIQAEQLSIKVLAEGIETREEYNWLKQAGADFGQGYLFGKPAPEPIQSIHLV